MEVRTLFIMLRAVLEGSNKQMLFIFGRRNCAIKYLVEDYIIPWIYMLQQCEKNHRKLLTSREMSWKSPCLLLFVQSMIEITSKRFIKVKRLILRHCHNW